MLIIKKQNKKYDQKKKIQAIKLILEKIDKLGYFDKPNFNDYINILKESIKTEKIDYNYFIWEKKLMPKFN